MSDGKIKKSGGASSTLITIVKAIVTIVFGVAALIMTAYSSYALYDTFYINRQALSSTDLQQYRPNVEIENIGDDEVPLSSGDDLSDVIEDYVGWVTVYDTNIDYPVVQGENDLEYASKDVFGRNSISGAIYLATDNHGDFTDLYSVLYGHHMDNGAMFGDVDNYLDSEYFFSHDSGVLITNHGVYNLKIFSVIKTDAYEGMIYSVSEQNTERFEAQKEFIKENAEYYDASMLENTKKILAMSTCSSISTNGRIVIFADMVPRTEPLEPREEEIVENLVPLAPGMRAVDKGGSWALVNLITLICQIYLFIPVFSIKRKYGRNKLLKALNEFYSPEHQVDVPKFRKRSFIGFIVELVLSLSAVILFILTENMRLPMVLVDKWTIWMLVLYVLCWAIDVWLLRWRRADGELEDALNKENKPSTKEEMANHD